MVKIAAFHGSPRRNGNSSILLNRFLEGAKWQGATCQDYHADELQLENCQGCLRCNILKRCSIRGDDFEYVGREILASDILVFASPVYFHHLTAPLKKLVDRFRSFVHVQITEEGLIHTPHQEWKKDFVLLLSMGSPDPVEAQPIIDLFKYMTSILGADNRLHVITATRLAMSNQLIKNVDELRSLYPKLQLPGRLAAEDYIRNQEILDRCYNLGMDLSSDSV